MINFLFLREFFFWLLKVRMHNHSHVHHNKAPSKLEVLSRCLGHALITQQQKKQHHIIIPCLRLFLGLHKIRLIIFVLLHIHARVVVKTLLYAMKNLCFTSYKFLVSSQCASKFWYYLFAWPKNYLHLVLT